MIINPTQTKNEVKVDVNKTGVSSGTFLAKATWKVAVAAYAPKNIAITLLNLFQPEDKYFFFAGILNKIYYDENNTKPAPKPDPTFVHF